ncbi:MAG TPA: metallophosphoesterase [Thermoanaerobaculaceae bacterium]|nr:metallophosphoesterase [Thermoanaerobaculaceae bacterium]
MIEKKQGNLRPLPASKAAHAQRLSAYRDGAAQESDMKRRWERRVSAFAVLLISGAAFLGKAGVAGAGQTQGAAARQPATIVSAPSQPAEETLLGTLPPELRDAGAAIVRESNEDQKARLIRNLLRAADGTSGGRRVAPQARDFVIALVDAKQCPTKSEPCIRPIAATLKETPDPLLRKSLERWASSYPDPEVAVAALNALIEVDSEELSRLLQKRIDLAKEGRDSVALRTLGRSQERLGSSRWGMATLPSFLWDPPPVFSARPESGRIRVLAISDFGTGDEEQKLSFDTMLKFHRAQPFDFGITLGDNFQDDGAHSPGDPRWQQYWEQAYPQLGIPFYVSMGNHDWGSPDGPAAEILYSQKSAAWRLPAPYYTFTAGPVQFFTVNTVLMSEAQLLWLRDELEKSTAKWKVVYGHLQVYSALRGDNDDLIRRLQPILEEHHVDLYLCGHEHLFQHLRRGGNVHFFVNGAAGGGARSVEKPGYEGLLFVAEKQQGFTILEADGSSLTVRFIGEDGRQLYTYALQK